MKEEKRNCKIIEDLLPAYIDNILSEETRTFVEMHLKECPNCEQTYQEMIAEIKKEDVQNTENVKIIKKYKRKIRTLKIIVALTIFIILAVGFGTLSFRYMIVKNALIKNINYDAKGNFRLEYYEDSIEHYNYHTTTYVGENKMKKVKGDKVIEYWENDKHYIIDNEKKTYYIKNEDIKENDKLKIPIMIIPEMKNIVKENGISPIEILKFILTSNITVQTEGFRTKEYYVIKDMKKGLKIYFDKETFFAERIVQGTLNTSEYRTLLSSVSWHEVEKPNFLDSYTLVEENM